MRNEILYKFCCSEIYSKRKNARTLIQKISVFVWIKNILYKKEKLVLHKFFFIIISNISFQRKNVTRKQKNSNRLWLDQRLLRSRACAFSHDGSFSKCWYLYFYFFSRKKSFHFFFEKKYDFRAHSHYRQVVCFFARMSVGVTAFRHPAAEVSDGHRIPPVMSDEVLTLLFCSICKHAM